MLRQNEVIGAIAISHGRVAAFSDTHVELLKTFADQAVIAIENVRLFTQLQERNREVTEALERQTATSEILNVISSSPTDVRPVFEAICQSAVRLFGAYGGGIIRFDGQLMHLGAVVSPSAEADERYRQLFPRPPDRELLIGRAILDRTVVHVADVEQSESARVRDLGRDFGYRRILVVPMLREGEAVGALTVTGREPGLYSDRQIDVLKTFADQAVIAIENVRLLKELEVRNRDLTQALEQQTATGEILQAISRSPTDAQLVFVAIAANAARLCDANEAQVLRVEGEVLRLVAASGAPSMPSVRRLTRGHLVGRAVIDRKTKIGRAHV